MEHKAIQSQPSALTPGLWERPGPDGAPSLEQLDLSIGELAAQIDAASCRLLLAVAEFDRRDGWAHAGARSCAHWLSFRTGLSLGTARDQVRVARRLEVLPRISQAFAAGRLSYSKVRALVRIATPESEKELVEIARTSTASQVERLVRAYRRVSGTEQETARRQHEGRYLRLRYDDDGCLLLDGRLPPEVGAMVQRALEAAETELKRTQASEPVSAESAGRNRQASGEPSRCPVPQDAGQRRADALGLLAERGMMQLGTGERGEPYHVVVHVDAEVLAADDADTEGQCHVEGGPALSARTVRRLCCDAPEVKLSESQAGEALFVGRKSRRVSRALWRALRTRAHLITPDRVPATYFSSPARRPTEGLPVGKSMGGRHGWRRKGRAGRREWVVR